MQKLGVAGPEVEPASGGATVQELIHCTTRAPLNRLCAVRLCEPILYAYTRK